MTDSILIVEDERRLAELLRDYLKAAGYEVRCIGDGAAAVDCIRDRTPSLVLLDLMLPGKDGLDVCREVRAFSDVPIIMTTARVEEVDRLLGLELGADDYVSRPCCAAGTHPRRRRRARLPWTRTGCVSPPEWRRRNSPRSSSRCCRHCTGRRAASFPAAS